MIGAVGQTPAVIGAIGGAIAAIVTSYSAVVAVGNRRRSKHVQQQVGDTNGQGTLAEMVSRIDLTTADTSIRMTNIDRRQLKHEESDGQAFDEIHEQLAAQAETLVRHGDQIDAIAKHLFDQPKETT